MAIKNVNHAPMGDADICQCPKCLEVQEIGEACIKCGLIFRKYYKSEHFRKMSSYTVTINNDQYKESIDPRLHKIFNRIAKTAYIYLIASVFIALFDLGKYKTFKLYCSFAEILIPSLHGSSIISKDPNNTCLVLAISWTMTIIMICLLAKWCCNKTIINLIIRPQNLIVRISCLCVFIILVVSFYLKVPSNPEAGRSSKFIYSLLRNGAITSAIWGLGIYMISLSTFISILITLSELIDKGTRNKGS